MKDWFFRLLWDIKFFFITFFSGSKPKLTKEKYYYLIRNKRFSKLSDAQKWQLYLLSNSDKFSSFIPNKSVAMRRFLSGDFNEFYLKPKNKKQNLFPHH